MEPGRRDGYATPVTVYEQIGRRVAALREQRGWTQEYVAERARTSAAYLARIEAGVRQATVAKLATVAKALDVPLWRLFTSGRLTGEEREWSEAARELAAEVGGLDADAIRALLSVARRMRR